MERGREDSDCRVGEDDWIGCWNDDENASMSSDDGTEGKNGKGEMDNANQSETEIEEREEIATPSWIFLQYPNDEMRVIFMCLCNKCEWKGEDETELALHLKEHVHSELNVNMMDVRAEGDQPYVHSLFLACPVPFCNRAFSIHSIDSMGSHMSMHAHHASLQKKGLIALYSKEEFLNVRSCGNKEKLGSAHSGDAHICMWDDCNMRFLDINHFFSHVLSHMELMEDLNCHWDSCNHGFKHKSRLIAHIHHHMGMKAGACPFCGEVFSSFSKLYDHVARKREDEKGAMDHVLCKLCRKQFPNKKSLQLHIKRHIVRFRCEECGVLFSSKHDINRHWESIHSQPLSLVMCSFPNCTAAFASNAKLMQHLKIHREGSLSCPHCHTKFRWIKQLTKHINLEHSQEGLAQYVCHVCNRHYEEGSSLSRHLKKKHSLQIPPGFPRFQYKKCEDGLFRLQTSRPCT